MDKEKRENLVNDIENRLDHFFNAEEAQPQAPPETVSMEKLKSLVLSIDWEITEECLAELIEETDVLMPHHMEDRYAHTLLRMLRAVSDYIRRHKARAHPDAIKRIMSVFASLEHLTGKEDIDEDLKKRIVANEIAAFKKLKEQVDAQRGVVAGQGAGRQGISAGEGADYVECSHFEQAMNEVEQRLNTQVSNLKDQVSLLQKELDQLRST